MLLKEITFTLSKSKENIKKSKTTAKYLIEFLTSSPVHLFNGKKTILRIVSYILYISIFTHVSSSP